MKHLILAVIAAVLASVVTVKVMGPVGGVSEKKESAYERVMRTGVLRCSYGISPPNLSIDPNTKELSGSDKDILERVGKELGIQIEWVEEIGWGNVIQGLDTGRYDAFCGTVWADGPRRRNMSLVTPYYYMPMYAFVRAGDKRFDGDLSKINSESVTIGAVDGDVTYNAAKLDYPKARLAALPQTASLGEYFENVRTGKADVAFADRGTVEDYNKMNDNALAWVEGVPISKIYGNQIGVAAGEVRLKELLDGTVQHLINNGVIDEIMKKYPQPYLPAFKDFAQ